jgi:pyruvate/2-oxoglutarate dehydrogenase complex dihydrolipoamide dehydrogenase (E3) component
MTDAASELAANVRPPAWTNPEPAERYHLVIIGGGPAGLAAAYAAAALGAKVALVERDRLGGTDLNVGTVPSKAIIQSSRVFAEMRDSARYGVPDPADVELDFAGIMKRMRRLRVRASRNATAARLVTAGVDVFFGAARFVARDTIEVAGATLRFRKAMIATGSRPHMPAIPGLLDANFLTNETVFDLTTLPRRLLVIGGGPLGCELAQAFHRLGAHTTIAQNRPLFLPKEERDAAQILSDALARDGLEVRLNTTVTRVRTERGESVVDLVSDDYHSTVTVDAIFNGTGRRPNVEGLNLEVAEVDHDPVVGIHVDDLLRTTNRRIYAAGDVCLEHKFTHIAEATGRMVVRNALFLGREHLSELVVPWCTFTDPEIAHVGKSVRDAHDRDVPVTTYVIPLHEVTRAITDGIDVGFVKIHVRDGTDRILGATIVARHAGEMIGEITGAMTAGVGLRTLARVIHTSPVQAGAIQMAAQAFCRTQITPSLKARLRRWLTR